MDTTRLSAGGAAIKYHLKPEEAATLTSLKVDLPLPKAT
jgi:hypothetical protein